MEPNGVTLPDDLADIMLWFIMQGNPDLILKKRTVNVHKFINWNIPRKAGEKQRELGFIGYGIFND